jgi:hypothetical protein
MISYPANRGPDFHDIGGQQNKEVVPPLVET